MLLINSNGLKVLSSTCRKPLIDVVGYKFLIKVSAHTPFLTLELSHAVEVGCEVLPTVSQYYFIDHIAPLSETFYLRWFLEYQIQSQISLEASLLLGDSK